jgi:transcriptional regulator with XRE-family HTH domain
MSTSPSSNQPESKHINTLKKAVQAREKAKARFGNILRGLREDRNMSQVDLSEQIGVSPLTVHRWESGESLPYPHYRGRLCDLFEVDREVLFSSELRKIVPPKRKKVLHSADALGQTTIVPLSETKGETKLNDEEKAQDDVLGHEQDILAAEKRNLDRLKMQKERMASAIETANMVIDTFYPHLEQSARDTTMVALVQKLLQEPGEATINSFIEHYRPLYMNTRKAENG